MPKLLVLANMELAFEYPEGGLSAEELARKKERHLLRLLRRLVEEESETGLKGTVERLEFEGFGYAAPHEAEPSGYYYDKVEREAGSPESGG